MQRRFNGCGWESEKRGNPWNPAQASNDHAGFVTMTFGLLATTCKKTGIVRVRGS